MKAIYILPFFLCFFYIHSCNQTNTVKQYQIEVKDQTLISTKLPAIKIQINEDFKYVGYFSFTINDIAAGERHIFIDESDNMVRRLFIAQFEGFYPTNDEIYRYSFKNALEIGNHKFKQNTFAYSNSEALKNNPNREGALTAKFLKSKEYQLEDELMLSRYVTLGHSDRKSELILFYIENVSPTGFQIEDFYSGDNITGTWDLISKGLNDRALESFSIID